MKFAWKRSAGHVCVALQAAGLIGIVCTACVGETGDTDLESEVAGGESEYADPVAPEGTLPPASLCGATTFWYPTPVSETDSTGTQANGSISTGIRVEVRQSTASSDTGLQARVCKSSGTFSNNIAFSIYDGATNSSSGVVVYTLATAGLSCSAWVNLQNDTGYSNGQMFGGIWQVVSPATSAAGWGFPFGSCGVSGSPTGTCWNGVNISMMRTCK